MPVTLRPEGRRGSQPLSTVSKPRSKTKIELFCHQRGPSGLRSPHRCECPQPASLTPQGAEGSSVTGTDHQTAHMHEHAHYDSTKETPECNSLSQNISYRVKRNCSPNKDTQVSNWKTTHWHFDLSNVPCKLCEYELPLDN